MARLLLLLLSALPISSFAEMYDAEYGRCNKLTTVDIVDCVGKAAKSWDRRLNESYQALLERTEAAQQGSLKTAQRQWIKYRDANCQFYASGPGTIVQVEAAECMRAMTKARTCELQSANNMEGRSSPECS